MSNHDNAPPDRLQLLARLLTTPPDPQACARCLAQLDGYIAAQQGGSDYQALMPEVAQHLDQCVDCAEAYQERYEEPCVRCEALLEDYIATGPDGPIQLPKVARHLARCAACTEAHRLISVALASDPVQQPLEAEFAEPIPDLHFLLPDATGPLSPDQLKERLWREQLGALLGRATQHLDTGLRFQLSPDLLVLAQRAQASAAMRGGPEATFQLELDAPSQTIKRLSIASYSTGQAGRCDLEVKVTAAGRKWLNQDGIAVELHLAGETRRDQTNKSGIVLFRNVPEAALPEAKLAITM